MPSLPRIALLLSAFVAASTMSPLAAAQGAEDLSEETEAVPSEYVVDLKDDVDGVALEGLRAKVRDLGATLDWNSTSSPEGDHLALLRGTEDRSVLARAIERLRGDAHVEALEESLVFRASFVPNDPLYKEKQWHLARVGAERAWDYGCGHGVTVAVIDTGVACFDKGPFTRGTDLQGTRCKGGYNFVHDVDEAYDDQGHGTHVAGTIAQTTNNERGVAGLAHCANLMPVKVLNKNGWGTLADVAEGIRYAADHGAQIINLSLGGPRPASVLEKAVRYAERKGVLIVAAAGNSGRSVGYPAAYPGVLAVSATDSGDRIAWFSSRGPQVGIAAPGVSVTQQTICDGGKNKCELFGTFNGTSMASPHVAGAAALVAGLGVSSPDALRSALTGTAAAKDDAKLYGAGLLDAGNAVARTHWARAVERALAIVAFFALVAMRVRKRGWLFLTPGAVVASLVAGVGLLPFLPLLGVLPTLGEARPLAELLMRPFGEWDLFVGHSLHRWLLLASAGPALLGYALFFGVRSLRPVLGGFAVGAAALLAQTALMADVAFPMGTFLLRVFAVANIAVLLWLARLGLDRKPT